MDDDPHGVVFAVVVFLVVAVVVIGGVVIALAATTDGPGDQSCGNLPAGTGCQ